MPNNTGLPFLTFCQNHRLHRLPDFTDFLGCVSLAKSGHPFHHRRDAMHCVSTIMKKAAEKSVGGGIGVCGMFGSTNPLHFSCRLAPLTPCLPVSEQRRTPVSRQQAGLKRGEPASREKCKGDALSGAEGRWVLKGTYS